MAVDPARARVDKMTVVWSDPAYAVMARMVSATIGISFPESRRRLIEESMKTVWSRARSTSPLAYVADLVAGTTSVDDLVNELVVGETYFFREPGQFALLQAEIFPELRHRLGRGLAMWSAGCASGEEAYSLAIAAAASAPEGVHDRVFATDVSTRSLVAARAGVYGSWSMRGVSDRDIDRISVRRDKSYVVRDRWRRSVEFAYGNLAAETEAPFPAGTGAIDLIMCRNVLIYFDERAVRCAAALLYSALRDGGYLLTSPSDPLLSNLAPFVTVMTDAGIVYRRRDAAACQQPRADARNGARATAQIAAGSATSDAPGPRADRERLRTPGAEPGSSEQAELALSAGRWAKAADLTASLDDVPSAMIHVRAMANAHGTSRAERACASAAIKHPTSAVLHHVHAILLLELDRLDDAIAAARRSLFLDPAIAAGHLVLATIAQRAGDLGLARRSYRNACTLLRDQRDDAQVALAEGQRAGALRRAAEAALASLEHRSAPANPGGELDAKRWFGRVAW